MTYFKLIFVIIACGACSSAEVQNVEFDPFIAEMIASMEELLVVSITELKTEENDIFVPMRITQVGPDRYIVVEGQRWIIHLMTSEGIILDTAGGAGQGPGQFRGISQIERSNPHQLYALDWSLQRITVYDLADDKLEYVRTIPLPSQPEQQTLRTIHVSDAGNYGVLMSPRPNRTFQLHKLNESFLSVEKIFEMDGHFPNIHFSNSQLTNAIWFFDNHSTTFNYIYFDSVAIHSVNLLNQSINHHIIHDPHRNRLANSMNHAHIAKAFRSNQDPAYEPDPNLQLPHSFNALRQGDIMVINLLYYGGSNTILLHYDMSTKKTKYIKAPPGFFLESFTNDVIIGQLVQSEMPNKVMMLKIDE
jgi:hypothetical protein